MKGFLAAGIATALAIIAVVYRLSTPVPAGQKALKGEARARLPRYRAGDHPPRW
jgi:hypothetical protein